MMEAAMTDNPITLSTGQTATLEEGVMRVTDSAPPTSPVLYWMTTRHSSGAPLDVRCAELDGALAMLRQLEPLGYVMRNIVRVSG
jgi:hypothetical protein